MEKFIRCIFQLILLIVLFPGTLVMMFWPMFVSEEKLLCAHPDIVFMMAIGNALLILITMKTCCDLMCWNSECLWKKWLVGVKE